jgi:hypothetical protein
VRLFTAKLNRMIKIEIDKLKEGINMGLGSQGVWTPELAEIILIEIQKQVAPLQSVSGCPFEAYAVFCIECDRQGIKPIKHKDYLEMG